MSRCNLPLIETARLNMVDRAIKFVHEAYDEYVQASTIYLSLFLIQANMMLFHGGSKPSVPCQPLIFRKRVHFCTIMSMLT